MTGHSQAILFFPSEEVISPSLDPVTGPADLSKVLVPFCGTFIIQQNAKHKNTGV